MRDPKRIDELLGALAMFWKQNPDLRLGQIVVNAGGKPDPFYVEDEVMHLWLINNTAR